jgi:hypothetical protein
MYESLFQVNKAILLQNVDSGWKTKSKQVKSIEGLLRTDTHTSEPKSPDNTLNKHLDGDEPGNENHEIFI